MTDEECDHEYEIIEQKMGSTFKRCKKCGEQSLSVLGREVRNDSETGENHKKFVK